jgi:hypothetical protein
LIQYVDGCATSEVKAIADKLGLSVSVDRSFSEEKFTDFAVDFAVELNIPIADIRFKSNRGSYKVVIPDSDIGIRLSEII